MSGDSSPYKRVIVRLIVSYNADGTTEHDVAYDAYRAVIEATRDKYAVMGYDWEQDKTE